MRFRKKGEKRSETLKNENRGNAFDDENWIYEISQGIDEKKNWMKTKQKYREQ